MTPQLTIDALREMRFSGMAAEFQFQLDDPAYYGQLGFEERFSMLGFAQKQLARLKLVNPCVRRVYVIRMLAVIFA